MHLSEVQTDHLDQCFGGLGPRGIGFAPQVDDMHANVVFDHIAHQHINASPRAGNKLVYTGAVDFHSQFLFECLYLRAYPAHAVEELGFRSNGVRHTILLLLMRRLIHRAAPIGA
jgi:hypothetical protein